MAKFKNYEVFISTPIDSDFTKFTRVAVNSDRGIDDVIRSTRKSHPNAMFFVVDEDLGHWVLNVKPQHAINTW